MFANSVKFCENPSKMGSADVRIYTQAYRPEGERPLHGKKHVFFKKKQKKHCFKTRVLKQFLKHANLVGI